MNRYLGMLADGRAADALAVPGVAVDSTELEAAGLPPTASDALLRRDALATLTDVEILSEEESEDGVVLVTARYHAGAFPGTTTFHVQSEGSVGFAPTWSFATSPLALMDLTVKGSMTFDVNGFTVDKRQVSPEGADADPQAPMTLLVFSPGHLLGVGGHRGLRDPGRSCSLRQPVHHGRRRHPGLRHTGFRGAGAGAGG